MSQPMFVPQRLLSLAQAFSLLTNAAACFSYDKANLQFFIANDHGDPVPCRIHLRHRCGAVVNLTGYNRVYVQLAGESFTPDNWFAALESGRCFVTNGPLLRVTANQAFAGETIDSNVRKTI